MTRRTGDIPIPKYHHIADSNFDFSPDYNEQVPFLVESGGGSRPKSNDYSSPLPNNNTATGSAALYQHYAAYFKEQQRLSGLYVNFDDDQQQQQQQAYSHYAATATATKDLTYTNHESSSLSRSNSVQGDHDEAEFISSPDFDLKLLPTKSLVKHKSTWKRAFVNLICSVVGVGVLSLPQALSHTGWCGIALIVIIAAVSNYTAKILVQCLYTEETKLHSYADIGDRAFGRVGRYITRFFQALSLIGIATLYLILAGTNLAHMNERAPPSFPIQLTVHEWIMICGAVTLPLSWMRMKEIGIMSMLGAATSLAVSVLVTVMSIISIAVHKTPIPRTVVPSSLESFSLAFAMITFAFGGQAVIPTIEDNMKKPSQYNRVLGAAFVVLSTFYLPLAATAYWAFGVTTQSPITQSLEDGVVKIIATLAITIHVLVAYALLLCPLFTQLEDFMLVPARTLLRSRVLGFFIRILLRSSIVCVTVVIALFLPAFDQFLALLGAVITSAIVFHLPVIFYLKIYRRSIQWYEVLFNVLVLLFVTAFSAIGAYATVKNLVVELRSTNG